MSGAVVSDDADDWVGDMDAWQLTAAQRTHHMKRVGEYHSRQPDRIMARTDRTVTVLLVWAALGFVLLIAVWLLP